MGVAFATFRANSEPGGYLPPGQGAILPTILDPKWEREETMCCIFTTLLFLGPRAGILVWWLVNPARFNLAFSTFILPLLGFLFLPWTTLMYLLVFPMGIVGFDWIWLGLGVLADIGMYAGGGYGNRDRFGR